MAHSRQISSCFVKPPSKLYAMKKLLTLSTVATLACLTIYIVRLKAADAPGFQTHEYATIRWGGRDNTHLIRPNGKVEMLGPLLTKTSRPDRTDERSFYMNLSANAVAREGYEVVAMTHDEIVMKRVVRRE